MINEKNKNIILNGLIDLAQPRLGTKVVYKTDDFFAAAKRIIDPSPPIFKEGVFLFVIFWFPFSNLCLRSGRMFHGVRWPSPVNANRRAEGRNSERPTKRMRL